MNFILVCRNMELERYSAIFSTMGIYGRISNKTEKLKCDMLSVGIIIQIVSYFSSK